MKPLRVIDTQINKSVRIILKYPSFGPSFAVAIIVFVLAQTSTIQLPMPSSTRRRKASRCSFPNCKKQLQTRRLCKAHGGGVRCRGSGCTKLAQSRGLCVAHGGGRRCTFDGCSKLAQCHTELPNSAERPRSAFHQRAAAAAIYR
ncbi:hypothetical protein PC115_g22272 [Phytophthora cactorum]|uniref:WRKY19-like zinc finger domain-containing protein n=1 Tax=Phytophthora cactorum TaxID=29920 RepID=A0A8T1AL65_9STRA|nr:hypothetical protein PC115_g22272 [Phytophthora cactorum]